MLYCIAWLQAFPLKQVLYLASLILAAAALQDFVRALPEPLGMCGVYQLPVKEHDARHEEKTPAVEVLYEEHRSEHHEVAPVIDPAVYAALVVHDERLERAEEQDAEVIAEIKRH